MSQATEHPAWYTEAMTYPCKRHARAVAQELRKRRLKATPARVRLLDFFNHSTEPVSAADVRRKLKRVDVATLYRNLDSLSTLGLLTKVRLDEREVRFELSARPHHHHVTCTLCGRVADVPGTCLKPEATRAALKASDFSRIERHSLEFFGLCKTCTKK